MAQRVARITRKLSVEGSNLIKPPTFALSKILYHHCLVLVCSRNGFERDFTIELN